MLWLQHPAARSRTCCPPRKAGHATIIGSPDCSPLNCTKRYNVLYHAGQREAPLRRKILEHRRTLPSPKAQQAADAAVAEQKIVVKLGGGDKRSGDGDSDDGAVAAAQPDAEPAAADAKPEAVPPAAAADAAAPSGGVKPKAEPAAAEQQLAVAEAAQEATEAGESPKVLKLRKTLQALRNSLSDEVIDPIRRVPPAVVVSPHATSLLHVSMALYLTTCTITTHIREWRHPQSVSIRVLGLEIGSVYGFMSRFVSAAGMCTGARRSGRRTGIASSARPTRPRCCFPSPPTS